MGNERVFVQLMDIIAVWLIDFSSFFSYFFSAGLLYEM
jgi:hypothetical protein